MGPSLPVHGAGPAPPDPRAMRLWVPFEVGGRAGFFHLHEDRHGDVLDCEGRVDRTDGGPSADVLAVAHRLEYEEGTARLRAGTFDLTLDGDDSLHMEFTVTCAPAHPQGFGYHHGWRDGGNPGVWRGVEHVEGERFDVADPTLLAGPVHTDPTRRLGGTEFTARLSDASGGEGMAHIEHMRYRPRSDDWRLDGGGLMHTCRLL